jgi:DMSO/TMAO reductase YedYZ molybdopterin-dependent catalytic subunit
MSLSPISRGFFGRRQNDDTTARIPPGQHLTRDFPVLSAGPTPVVNLETWRLSLADGDRLIAEWSWAELGTLPHSSVKVDIHCVTTWLKLDTTWRGVSFSTPRDWASRQRPTP